jgi:predicted transglutaminase-like cysteine proteinase
MKNWVLLILMMLAMPSMAAISTGAPLGTVVAEKGKPEAMFKKWRAMLSRDAKNSSCIAALDARCLPQDVLDFISKASSLSDAQKLKKVNAFVNRIRYRSDSSLYGINDYWASPGEFFSRGRGDCEDFSIAKYALLMALGFSSESMRMIITKDEKVRDFHAVLAVRVADQDYILDNRTNRLLLAKKQTYLKPIYALNNEHWWLYAGAQDLLKG